jgi:hypothetical protein
MSNENTEATIAIANAMTAISTAMVTISQSKQILHSDKVLNDMSEAMSAMTRAMTTASTQIQIQTPVQTQTHIDTQTHTDTHTYTDRHIYIDTQTHTDTHTYIDTQIHVKVFKKELEQCYQKTLYHLRTEPADILKHFGKEWKAATDAFSEIYEHNMLESRDQNELLKPEEKKRFELLSKTHLLNSKIIVLWLKNDFLSSSLEKVEKYKLSAEEVEAVNLLGRV